MFGQAVRQIMGQTGGLSFMRKKGRLWSVAFAGEGSSDAGTCAAVRQLGSSLCALCTGGPYRELFSNFCSELQSHALGLFIPSPNNR